MKRTENKVSKNKLNFCTPLYQSMGENETDNFNAIKRVRNRRTPNKRWTPNDVQSIIEFMRENPFEPMCSQSFFKRLEREKNLGINWKLIRAKICNMRAAYTRTAEWLNSQKATDNENLSDEETKSLILKMCPYYYEMDEILHRKTMELDFPAQEQQQQNDSDKTEIQFKTEEIDIGNFSELPENSDDNPNDISGITPISNMDYTHHDDAPPELRINSEPSLESSHLIKTELAEIETAAEGELGAVEQYGTGTFKDYIIKERELQLQQEKLNFEKRVKVRELQLREREILNQKLQLETKKLEIESKERLARMEMDLKERIANKELQLKYGLHNASIMT